MPANFTFRLITPILKYVKQNRKIIIPLVLFIAAVTIIFGSIYYYFVYGKSINRVDDFLKNSENLPLSSNTLKNKVLLSPSPKPVATIKPILSSPSSTPAKSSPTPSPAADLIVFQVSFIPFKSSPQKIDTIPSNGQTITVDHNPQGFYIWPLFENIGTVTARDVNITYYIDGVEKMKGFQSMLEPNVIKSDEKQGNPTLILESQSGVTHEVRIEINEDKKIMELNYGNNTHTFKYTVR